MSSELSNKMTRVWSWSFWFLAFWSYLMSLLFPCVLSTTCIFRCPSYCLSSCFLYTFPNAAHWCLSKLTLNKYLFFIFPVTTLRYISFHSLLLSGVDKRGNERKQHSILLLTGKQNKRENIYPWVCSGINSLTLLVKKMLQLPWHLASQSPSFLTWVTGRNDPGRSSFNDFLTQSGWQRSLWGETTSRTYEHLCHITNVWLGIITSLIETLESS